MNTIRKAIINYINARAEKIRPCKHEFELKMRAVVRSDWPREKYHKKVYMCKKCGIQKTLRT